jgi:two-component system, OmpR family, KDP operon response regulator KdpE
MDAAKILIGTNDATLARAFQTVLKAKGYEVATAHDDERILLLSGSGQYDLVVLDEYTSDGYGVETCQRIKSISEVPIIMMGRDDRAGAARSGADDYLRKPSGVSELFAVIGATLRREVLTAN